MKPIEFFEKYDPVFKQLLLAEAQTARKDSVSFKLLESRTENGITRNKVKCPDCDTVFEFQENSKSYNRYYHVECPHCSRALERAEPADIQKRNYSGYVAIHEGANLIVGYGNTDIFYSFDNKTFFFDGGKGSAEIYKGAILRPDSFEYFPDRNKRRANNLSDMFFQMRSHNSINQYEAMVYAWLNALGYRGYSPSTWNNDYEHHCDAVKAAKTITVKSTKITSFSEAQLPMNPVSEVESFFKKNAFVCVLEETNNITQTKESYIRCGNCGNEFYVKDDNHRTSSYYNGSCPHCGAVAKAFLYPSDNSDDNFRRYGRHIYGAYSYAVVQPYNGSIVSGDGVVIRQYSLEPVISLDPDNVPIYDFVHHPISAVFYGTKKKEFKSFVYDEKTGLFNADRSDQSTFNFVYVDLPHTKSFLDFSGLKELTDYYNAQTKSWSSSGWGYDSKSNLTAIRRYLDLRNKYPVMEKFVKYGLMSLVDYLLGKGRDANNCVDEMMKSHLFMDQDSIPGALGLPMSIIKECASDITNIYSVVSLRKFTEAFPNITPELVKYFKKNNIDCDRIKEIADVANVSCDHVMKYLENVRCFQCYEPSHSSSDWLDYLRLAKSIGMNLKDKYVLYPRSLKRDHDIALKKASMINNEEISKDFAEQVKRAESEYAYKTQTTLYEVRPPKDLEELFEEGRKLSHSVGSYGDAIASGKMCIMFIRKACAPDEPYFTVEINETDKSIAQLRSFSNRLIDTVSERDLALFVKQWGKMRHPDDSLVLPKKIA